MPRLTYLSDYYSLEIVYITKINTDHYQWETEREQVYGKSLLIERNKLFMTAQQKLGLI